MLRSEIVNFLSGSAMAPHLKEISCSLDWQRNSLSMAERRCANKAFAEVIKFFLSMKSISHRFKSGESQRILRSVIALITLNSIDGYLIGRNILINSDVTQDFENYFHLEKGYLNSLVEALSAVGLINIYRDKISSDPDEKQIMASDSLLEILKEDKSSLLENSRPLDVHIWSEYSEVNGFVDLIYKNHFGEKSSNIKKKHLKLVILDLYISWSLDPTIKISVARNNNIYLPKTRYNELHITKKTIDVVDTLEKCGLIRQTLGFFDQTRQTGKQTRIWPTGKLVEMFKVAKFGPFNIYDNNKREVIILNNSDPDNPRKMIEIEYDDTPETNEMRKIVRDYNDLLRRTFIDIPSLKDGFIELDDDLRGRPKRLAVNQRDKFTRRIFNRGSFAKGGRFFGGWWQRCPKEWREAIFLDDKPVSELDYSGLHIVMLYANAGIDYWAEIGTDPYALEAVPVDLKGYVTRDLCKQLMLVAINARDNGQAFGAFRDNAPTGSTEKRLSNGVLGQILDLLREKHKPIADKFSSDAGIDLMNQDARITAQIIRWFTHHDIPLLSIHDSYLVQMGWEPELESQMQAAFASVTGMQNVRIKESTHNPDLWEPLDAEDAISFDFKAWEAAREGRFNPPRSKRYLHELELFNRWLEETREEWPEDS